MEPSNGKYAVTWDAPVVRRAQVVVVGGGSAGIAAAVASARNGAHTLLVERYGFLGGTSTAGLVGPFMTSYDAAGRHPVVKGIFQEMVDRMVSLGGAIDPSQTEAGSPYSSFIRLGHAHVTPFSPEALKMAAMELVSEAGVELLLHTYFLDTIMDGGQIRGLVVANKGGIGVIEADVVVDTSADADVAARAGAPFEKGRPEDGRMQPVTLFLRVGDVDDAAVAAWVAEHERIHPGERLFACLVKEAKEKGDFPLPREHVGIYREPAPGEWRVNTTRVVGIDGTDPQDLTRAEVEGRRQVVALMRFFAKYCPGFAKARLLETAVQIGVRETRRIVGEYVLTGQDVMQGRRFDDGIGRCAYPIDIHDPSGATTGRLVGIQGDYYHIPYRSLLPLKVDNLLVGGRCISADHEAHGSVRVIPPCYVTGQAAGTAAALAITEKQPPRRVDYRRLQERLRSQDVLI